MLTSLIQNELNHEIILYPVTYFPSALSPLLFSREIFSPLFLRFRSHDLVRRRRMRVAHGSGIVRIKLSLPGWLPCRRRHRIDDGRKK